MDLPFVGSNEMIRYDLTALPTNVGDDVPEELQPQVKIPEKTVDESNEEMIEDTN